MDKEISKLSKSGITIGGNIPLEGWINREEAEELTINEFSERYAIHHGIKEKFKEDRGKSGHVKHYTMKEINAMKWEDYLMDAKTIDHAIISVLMSGQKFTGSQIRDKVVKTHPEITHKKYYARNNHILNRTDLGKLVERKRVNRGYEFSLVPAALELTLPELHEFVYMNTPRRSEIMEKHKGIVPYIVDGHAETKKKEPPDLQEKPTFVDVEFPKNLGVNIHVSGSVQIKFSFGLD